MPIIPHVWASGIVGRALQFIATLPPAPLALKPIEPMLEYDQSAHPFRQDLIFGAIRMEQGRVRIPDGPASASTSIATSSTATSRIPKARRVQFELERHEPLCGIDWDAARARAGIQEIVADMEDTFGAGIGWPAHELDAPEAPRSEWKTLYLGASGSLWAMSYLQRAGAVTLQYVPPI